MLSYALTYGGRGCARQLLVAVVLAINTLSGAVRLLASDTGAAPVVTVTEEHGVFSVIARFEVSQSPSVALSVLTDYERIPRFMPGIKTSVVRERTPGGAVIEQEAVSRLMMFSKRVHLVLEIAEGPDRLRFRDRCGKSFLRYEGQWRTSAHDDHTQIVYELTAEPSFEVPGFILKRLLKRDSGEMIAHLQREIAARALDRSRAETVSTR